MNDYKYNNVEAQGQGAADQAAEHCAGSSDADDDDGSEKLKEEREERQAVREELERKVKDGELIKLVLIDRSKSKIGTVLVRYYDPYGTTRHYLLTNAAQTDAADDKKDDKAQEREQPCTQPMCL